MAWRETEPVTERLAFIAELKNGDECVSALCDRFGVSRKTGYKWLRRFESEGIDGLKDRPRKALSHPNKTNQEVVELVLRLKQRKPRWGPKKIRQLLKLETGREDVPSASTVGEILKRNGLVVSRPKRRKAVRLDSELREPNAPNDCWSADFKGEFLVRGNAYCYPLTIMDMTSRYLLRCQGLLTIDFKSTKSVFEEIFREFGLPNAIRTDNGMPFGGNRGLSISKLSLWWLRLGIRHERIQPGVPQQNGRHERMHLTLKKDACDTLRELSIQQDVFDMFRSEYNNERPHEALQMATPREIFRPSGRVMPKHLPPLTYPANFETRIVGGNGRFSFEGQTYFISKVLSGECIGLDPMDNHRIQIWTGGLLLGVLNLEDGWFEPNVDNLGPNGE